MHLKEYSVYIKKWKLSRQCNLFLWWQSWNTKERNDGMKFISGFTITLIMYWTQKFSLRSTLLQKQIYNSSSVHSVWSVKNHMWLWELKSTSIASNLCFYLLEAEFVVITDQPPFALSKTTDDTISMAWRLPGYSWTHVYMHTHISM